MTPMRVADSKEDEAMVTVTNALCVDVDDLSLSSLEAGHASSRRVSYEAVKETLAVLTELDNLRIAATFFVPGYVAKRSPELVRAIVNAGHDVAAHGTRHCRVSELGPAGFREDVRASRGSLEDVAQVRVDTYKAPMWSIEPSCAWAYDVLIEEGFRVDHSAMPSMKKYLGHSRHQLLPFRYRKELLIIPPTTVRILGGALPFCGGFHLAYVPHWVQRQVLSSINLRGIPFNYYFHPFEHSPSPRNRRLVKYGSVHVTLYAAHAGRYRRHLRALAGCFSFAPLKAAYEAYLV